MNEIVQDSGEGACDQIMVCLFVDINGLKFLLSKEKRQQCPTAAKPIIQSANSVVTPSKLDCYEYNANILCLTLHAVTIVLTIPVYCGTFLILQV